MEIPTLPSTLSTNSNKSHNSASKPTSELVNDQEQSPAYNLFDQSSNQPCHTPYTGYKDHNLYINGHKFPTDIPLPLIADYNTEALMTFFIDKIENLPYTDLDKIPLDFWEIIFHNIEIDSIPDGLEDNLLKNAQKFNNNQHGLKEKNTDIIILYAESVLLAGIAKDLPSLAEEGITEASIDQLEQIVEAWCSTVENQTDQPIIIQSSFKKLIKFAEIALEDNNNYAIRDVISELANSTLSNNEDILQMLTKFVLDHINHYGLYQDNGPLFQENESTFFARNIKHIFSSFKTLEFFQSFIKHAKSHTNYPLLVEYFDKVRDELMQDGSQIATVDLNVSNILSEGHILDITEDHIPEGPILESHIPEGPTIPMVQIEPDLNQTFIEPLEEELSKTPEEVLEELAEDSLLDQTTMYVEPWEEENEPSSFDNEISYSSYQYISQQTSEVLKKDGIPVTGFIDKVFYRNGYIDSSITTDNIKLELRALLLNKSFTVLDLSGLDLSGLDLSNLDLSGFNLNGANLDNCKLKNVKLKKATLVGASMKNANLISSDLTYANLSNADLTKATLHHTKMMKAKLYKADLSSVNAFKADLSNADLTEAILNNSNFIDANFYQAKMHRAKLCNSDLHRAELKQVDLSEADLKNAMLEDTIFSGANLSKANLYRANLKEAVLDKVNLTSANLEDANLIKASLHKANLTDANLSWTKLRKAFLDEAIMIRANLNSADLYKASLLKANLTNAILNNAKLISSNLSLALLINAQLIATTLTEVILTKTNLRGANFEKATLTNTNFLGNELEYTNFKRTKIVNTFFHHCDFSKTQFDKYTEISLNEEEMKNFDAVFNHLNNNGTSLLTIIASIKDQTIQHKLLDQCFTYIETHNALDVPSAFTSLIEITIIASYHNSFVEKYILPKFFANREDKITPFSLPEYEFLMDYAKNLLSLGKLENFAIEHNNCFIHLIMYDNQYKQSSLAVELYDKYLQLEEIKPVYNKLQELTIDAPIIFFNKIAQEHLCVDEEYINYILGYSFKEANWTSLCLFKDYQIITKGNIDPNTIFKTFKLFAKTYNNQMEKGKLHRIIDSIILDSSNKYHKIFIEALSSQFFKIKIVAPDRQIELHKLFEHIISQDSLLGELPTLNISHITNILQIFSEIKPTDYRRIAQLFIVLSGIFAKYSSSYIFGTHDDSPQVLRIYAAALLKYAIKIAPNLIPKKDQKDWLDKFTGKTYECTGLLSELILLFCKDHDFVDYNLVPLFWR